MSTRGVDLQSMLFRLQDVQQQPGSNQQQQPQVQQAQFSQMFVGETEKQKEQVQADHRPEGKKIRADEKNENERERKQRRGRRQNQQSSSLASEQIEIPPQKSRVDFLA